MQINKGDRIDLIGDTSYKAVSEFDLEKIVEEFSSDYRYIEETMTKGSYEIFLGQLTNWLLEKNYIKPTAKAIVRITVSDFRSDNPHFTAIQQSSAGLNELKIPLLIEDKEVGQYTFNCSWRIDRSKPVIRN